MQTSMHMGLMILYTETAKINSVHYRCVKIRQFSVRWIINSYVPVRTRTSSLFIAKSHKAFVMSELPYFLAATSTAVWYRLWTPNITGLIPMTRTLVGSNHG